MFLSWRDISEILILSWALYRFLTWLSTDTTQHLVFRFYGLSLVGFSAYFLHLQTLSFVFLLSLPCIIVLFVTIHQKTLQKNYVALKNLTPLPQQKTNWLKELMKVCLTHLNKNQPLVCIIQRNDDLSLFLSINQHFNANLSQATLELLLKRMNTNKVAVVWAHQTGKLVTTNPRWHLPIEKTWIADELSLLDSYKHDALAIASKTDALIFTASPSTRLFDLIIEGKIIGNLEAAHAYSLIQKYLRQPQTQGDIHAIITAKDISKQKHA